MSEDPILDRVAAVIHAIRTTMPGWPGGTTDLTDLHIILENGGHTAFGEGAAEGPDRATKAAEAAIADLRRHLRLLRTSE